MHETHRSKQGIANNIIQACEHITLTSTLNKRGTKHRKTSSLLFIFSPTITNHFFSFHSLHLHYHFIFSNSSSSFLSFSLQKLMPSLSHSPHNLTLISCLNLNFPPKLSHLFQWHPSLGKVPTSYPLMLSISPARMEW